MRGGIQRSEVLAKHLRSASCSSSAIADLTEVNGTGDIGVAVPQQKGDLIRTLAAWALTAGQAVESVGTV